MKKYLLSVLFLLFVFVPFRAANKTDFPMSWNQL